MTESNIGDIIEKMKKGLRLSQGELEYIGCDLETFNMVKESMEIKDENSFRTESDVRLGQVYYLNQWSVYQKQILNVTSNADVVKDIFNQNTTYIIMSDEQKQDLTMRVINDRNIPAHQRTRSLEYIFNELSRGSGFSVDEFSNILTSIEKSDLSEQQKQQCATALVKTYIEGHTYHDKKEDGQYLAQFSDYLTDPKYIFSVPSSVNGSNSVDQSRLHEASLFRTALEEISNDDLFTQNNIARHIARRFDKAMDGSSGLVEQLVSTGEQMVQQEATGYVYKVYDKERVFKNDAGVAVSSNVDITEIRQILPTNYLSTIYGVADNLKEFSSAVEGSALNTSRSYIELIDLVSKNSNIPAEDKQKYIDVLILDAVEKNPDKVKEIAMTFTKDNAPYLHGQNYVLASLDKLKDDKNLSKKISNPQYKGFDANGIAEDAFDHMKNKLKEDKVKVKYTSVNPSNNNSDIAIDSDDPISAAKKIGVNAATTTFSLTGDCNCDDVKKSPSLTTATGSKALG